MISRRTFLGISGATAAALVALYSIKWPTFDFLLSPEDILEGVKKEDWKATSCLNCPTRCAVKVRVVNEERAVRIIGNSNSAYSDGKTCPRSHVGLQVLYNPNRIAKPLIRQNASKGRNEDPNWVEIEWEGENGALNQIKKKLKELISTDNTDKLLIIQGLNTTSDEDLINRFAKSFRTPNLLREDDLETEADMEGKRLANISTNTGYDLENANYILSFGANIIESGTPLARNLRLWGKIRQERPNKAKVVVIDPRYSITACRADEWIRINPGTEGALAMGIANVIIREQWYDEEFVNSRASGFAEYKSLVLNNFNPDTVASLTGIDTDTIERIAEEFASYQPAIAWSGTGATNWPHGTYVSHAIYCLNALVGSIDAKGGIIYQESPPYNVMPSITGDDPGINFKQTTDLVLDNNPYKIDMAIGFNNNLIMSVPNTREWDKALSDIPYYIHIAPSMTEMAQYADIILPSCTYLEEWAYETAPPGAGYAEAKIKQPVIEPLHESRQTAKIIFDLVNDLDNSVELRFGRDSIGGDPEGFVEYRTNNFISLEAFKSNGVWPVFTESKPVYEYGKYDQIFETDSRKFEFHPDSLGPDSLNVKKLTNIDFLGIESSYPLILTTYHPVLDIKTGNQNYPWAQEIFLVMHGYGWDNFVEMNKLDANDKGIKDGDTVLVKSEFGEVKVKARVFEGIMRGVVAIASGQGHYACGQWADYIGVNPNEVIGIDIDEKSGQASFKNTRVRIEKV
ncbi:molybdopterin-dependent oxidoreductase [Chloroflexota bacterium]